MTVKDDIFEITSRRMKRDVSTLTEETDLKRDLGADSIDTVEIVFEIEEKYGISIPDHYAETINTIGDTISVVEKLIE